MRLNQIATHGVRSTALAICAFALACGPTWAQATQDAPPPSSQADNSTARPHPRMEHMQEHHLEKMTKHLHLTPDQVTQVKAIDHDGMTQITALRQDAATPPTDRHEKMKAIHEAQTAKIRAILTDEQKVKFDQMVAHEQDHAAHHHGREGDANQPAPPPPAA